MTHRRFLAILVLASVPTACRGIVADRDLPAAPSCEIRPPTIHDAEIKRRLEHGLERLTADGAAVPLGELSSQLERPSTDAFEPVPPVAGDPLPAASLQELVRSSVVVVGKRYLCGKCERWHVSTASGVVIAPSGVVVTSHHVVDGRPDSTFAVMTVDGAIHPVVEVLAADEASDVVLLRVDADGLPALPLRPGLAPGEAVHVLSHPDSAFWYFTSGVLARRFPFRHQSGKTVEMLDVTADFARGSSGGAVVDSTGAVVGIVRSTDSVYYTEENGRQRDLQMVFKRCTPIEAVLGLVR